MNMHPCRWVIILGILFAWRASAAVYYVNVNNPSPGTPYTSWATAATKIQDAIDVATNGDTVLVADGTYAVGNTGNRISLNKALTVQSLNGPAVTRIRGQSNPTMRCAYLSGNATLSGFTLTAGNDHSWGGGAYCNPGAVLSNCVVAGNVVGQDGGGVYGGILYNCTITGNSTVGTGIVRGYGGGVFGSACYSCILSGNSSSFVGGGAYQSTLNNCLIAGNSIAPYPNFGGGGGAEGCTLNNCTVVGNTVYYPSSGGGTDFSTLNNCIVYYNSPDNVSPGFYTANNCCTTPLPSAGSGSFTTAPLFVNLAGSDYHLQTNSPCINSGNNTYSPSNLDLDGNPRIAGGTVDVGTYEYQTPASLISYMWLQQFGLLCDGSADFLDTDGDGMSNYQEWIAGTDPTDASSLLRMQTAVPTNNPAGLIVTWQSVDRRTYYVQCSTNLAMQPAFSAIQSNIVGQIGTTSYIDTSATNGGPYFYRVGIQSAN